MVAVFGKNVLVVDDDVAVGEGLVALLGIYGYAAVHVDTAEAALRSIESSRPDALILDVILDDENGLSLYDQIAKRWPDVPVILVTGHIDDSRLPPVSARLRHLFKPFDSDELLDSLAALGVRA